MISVDNPLQKETVDNICWTKSKYIIVALWNLKVKIIMFNLNYDDCMLVKFEHFKS